jgi:hypothetical protein
MLPDPTPLPSELGVSLLDQWAAALPVRASPAYWRVFRHVAVLLAMSRAQSPGQAGMTLAAARTSQPPQPARGSDQPGPRP